MDFLPYFNTNVSRIKLVDKQKSLFMKVINVCLMITNALRITDIQGFLTNYGTTIGHTIYDCPEWTWTGSASAYRFHELTHVMQWSLLYALRYLLSAKWRAYYESVCIQTEWAMFPKSMNTENIKIRARKLTGYGIKYSVALAILNDRVKELELGIPQLEVKKMKAEYEEWKYEQGLQ
jgi:hypothetical protein